MEMTGIPWISRGTGTNHCGMVTEVAVIARERLLVPQYYRGKGRS